MKKQERIYIAIIIFSLSIILFIISFFLKKALFVILLILSIVLFITSIIIMPITKDKKNNKKLRMNKSSCDKVIKNTEMDELTLIEEVIEDD